MLRDLIAHKWYADAAMLTAVRGHEAAAADPEIRELMLHTLVSNRFWLAQARQVPFELEVETQPPASFDATVMAVATVVHFALSLAYAALVAS